MEDLLKASARMINLPSTGLTILLYPWIFWVLWTSRNQLLFEDKFFSETEMVAKAIKAAKEWQASLPDRKFVSDSPKDCHPSNSLPQVPAHCHLMCSDAAWNGSSFQGGLAWICKDAANTVTFQGTESRRYVSSALTAEALALKAGLSKAISSNIKDVICCSDSKVLIDAITGNKNVTVIRGILHDLGVLSNSFSSISFKFISRKCNGPADLLAKNALFLLSNNPSVVGNSID
ncbi:uncharacterized protein LOC108824595 [Raphanus sativus]|uniref:Uncharacterized protein LOC108824595 n=1 Tax=Raphanus sativus TaxID=3726 RepID=A0A9W3CH84_RAPSA|nr:uncharacterized protein LOC108824595 [Raphanus sativus]